MEQKVTKFLILFFSIGLNLTGFRSAAQPFSPATSEQALSKIYSKLTSLHDEDSILHYSSLFDQNMQATILHHPQTLSYPFQLLKDSNSCFIITSADGLFRKYTWDDGMGGTMRSFSEIDQWKSNGKIYAKAIETEEGDAGGFCSKIFTVNIAGKVYYLSVENGIFSSKDAVQSIQVYCIENDKLIDTVKLFKTKTKLLNSIDIEYDFFSVIDRPERPVELISYDDKQKIIYIAVVNQDGKVTDKNILYQLKDQYFEFIPLPNLK